MFIISGISAISLVIDGNLYITGVLPNCDFFLTGGKYAH